MVKEKSSLLTFRPIDKKFVAVFHNHQLIVLEILPFVKVSVNKFKPGLERCGTAAFVIDGLKFVSIDFLESLINLLLSTEHTHGMSLKNTDSIVIVDYQPREIVTFTVNKTVAICGKYIIADGWSGSYTCGDSHIQSPGNHHFPEIRSQCAIVKTEHSNCNGTDLPMSAGEKTAIRGMYSNDFSFRGIAGNLRDCSGKHPGVKTEQRLFPSLL